MTITCIEAQGQEEIQGERALHWYTCKGDSHLVMKEEQREIEKYEEKNEMIEKKYKRRVKRERQPPSETMDH